MATAAPAQQVAQAGLPFTIASRVSKRQSFTLANIPLAAAAPVLAPGTPVQIPAVGYLKNLRLEVTATITGGAPTFSADAPWNLIQQIAFKNSAGQNLVAPLSGYEWYIVNKYDGANAGINTPFGRLQDPKIGRQYAAVATTNIHFFLDIPLEFDAASGLGSIPALASNRSYQAEITFSAISTIFGGTPPTSVSVTVDATANYWDVPVGTTPGGVVQSTEPFGLGTLSLWQKENPPLAPGEQLTRSNNTGNVIRTLIYIAKTATGARTDADWTNVAELYVDNNPMLRYKKTEWQDDMVRQYGYDAAALDAAGGLDTGVYVIPFHLLAGGTAGDPNNSRAQLLATLDSTLLQLKGYSWGVNVSQLTTLTQAVASDNSAFIYSK
jgi:hypothetical protein